MGGAVTDPDEIAAYYRESRTDYELVWDLGSCHALHAGYHDEATDGHAAAVENLNRVLADAVDLGPDDRVVDCGCGVGGSSVWLAERRGATVHGVDLVPMQLADARALAVERGVRDSVAFARQDFTTTAYPDGAFDVVWAIESVCHVAEKAEFAAEAARLLGEDGRLVMADAFRTPEPMTPDEQAAMNRWLDGWAVPNLATAEGFREALVDHGFEDVRLRDVTEHVLPSSRRLYLASRLFGPLERALNWVGYRSDAQTDNRVAARYQYETLRDGLWTYRIVTAER